MLTYYLSYGKSGVHLAVPLHPAVAHFRLVFENGDLVPLALANHLSDDLGPLNRRRAHPHILAISDEQHLIQLYSAPFLCGQALHINGLPWGDLVLLSSCLNYGVNPAFLL